MIDVKRASVRLLVGLSVAGCGPLLLACGSSSGGVKSSSRLVASSERPSIKSASVGCRSVAQPAPRDASPVPAPTLSLSSTKRYVVSLATNCGKIEIQLDVARAPKTSSSFAYLVKRGFYDDLTFHRVAAGFVIQGGDPDGDGSGGPGYTVVERPPANVKYTRGTVAMAKTGTDPAGASGSQFFIVTAHEAPLPPQYALVGKVIGSFAGVKAIAKLPTNPPEDGVPTTPVVISQATLAES